MTEWIKPNVEMAKNSHILALYYIEIEDEEPELGMGIFSFECIYNIFIGYNGSPKLKMKEIEYWMPIPLVPKDCHH